MKTIESITIYGGHNKNGIRERVEKIELKRGDIIGVVGPTGSGKSSLVSDIEQIAQEDTSTLRKVLINNTIPSLKERRDPRLKMIAQLSQNMNFIADMTVEEFLCMHSKCRNKDKGIIYNVVESANLLTGEAIQLQDNLTTLSGGQSRALMVADVAIISESPIVLIDEIENAGIRKHEALEMLSGRRKIIFVVTHDPVIALTTGKRIIMKDGGMDELVNTSAQESVISHDLGLIDQYMLNLRELIRTGQTIERLDLQLTAK